jgi:hypothetical protein
MYNYTLLFVLLLGSCLSNKNMPVSKRVPNEQLVRTEFSKVIFLNRILKEVYETPLLTEADVRYFMQNHQLTRSERIALFDTLNHLRDNSDARFGILLMTMHQDSLALYNRISAPIKSKIMVSWMMNIAKDIHLWCYPVAKRDENYFTIDTTPFFRSLKDIGSCCIPHLGAFLNTKTSLAYYGTNGESFRIARNLQLQKRDFAYMAIKNLLNQDAKLAYDRSERDEQIGQLKRELDTTFIDCK